MNEKRMEFRTVADFVALPPEKIGACLIDFCSWLETGHAIAAIPGLRLNTPRDMFEWIDDGKHVMSLVLHDETGAVIDRDEHEFASPEVGETGVGQRETSE